MPANLTNPRMEALLDKQRTEGICLKDAESGKVYQCVHGSWGSAQLAKQYSINRIKVDETGTVLEYCPGMFVTDWVKSNFRYSEYQRVLPA